MKRVLLVSLLLVASGAIVWTPPAVAVPPGCTEVGTPERDVIAGTGGHDKICTLGGGDYSHAGGSGDALLGGAGDDTLIGGDGKDRIRGAGGDDRLFSVDESTGDVIRGGRGDDSCFGDTGDAFRNCERTFRTGTSPEVEHTIAALSDTLFELVVLGEELQTQIDELIEIITTVPTSEPPFAECPPTVTDESPPPCV